MVVLTQVFLWSVGVDTHHLVVPDKGQHMLTPAEHSVPTDSLNLEADWCNLELYPEDGTKLRMNTIVYHLFHIHHFRVSI